MSFWPIAAALAMGHRSRSITPRSPAPAHDCALDTTAELELCVARSVARSVARGVAASAAVAVDCLCGAYCRYYQKRLLKDKTTAHTAHLKQQAAAAKIQARSYTTATTTTTPTASHARTCMCSCSCICTAPHRERLMVAHCTSCSLPGLVVARRMRCAVGRSSVVWSVGECGRSAPCALL